MKTSGRKTNTLTRNSIVKELMDLGFSRRKSVSILNSMIEAMKNGIKQGEEVDVPIGKFTLAPGLKSHRDFRFGTIVERFGKKRIKFEAADGI